MGMRDRAEELDMSGGVDVVIGAPEVMHRGFCQLERRIVEFKCCEGGSVSYEYINKPPAVAVLPYDPQLNQVVVIKQFRLGGYLNDGNGWLWETVAGIMDFGESPEKTAERELEEEVGLSCQQLLKIGDVFTSPGFTSEQIYLFLAVVDAARVSSAGGLATEHEYIKVYSISPDTLFEMLEHNRIKSGPSIILTQWFQLHFATLTERLRRG